MVINLFKKPFSIISLTCRFHYYMKLEYKRFEQINKFKWWHFSLIVAPILIYYYWIKLFGVNCPQLDDFSVLLGLMEISNASTFKEKLQLVFSPHNEHRIIFTKLVFGLVSTTDNGAVDIYKVLLIGNLTLIGLASIFYRAICHAIFRKYVLWYGSCPKYWNISMARIKLLEYRTSTSMFKKVTLGICIWHFCHFYFR